MRIVYNEIDLNVVQPIAIERTAVMDSAGMDTMYYHWRVVVEATYSPEILTKNWQFVSYGTQGEGPNKEPNPSHPVRNYRNPPPYTDVAIRQRLMEPQKKLYIWWDSDLDAASPDPRQIWVEAPSEAAPCDPINGPLPAQDISVTATLGQARTWRVRFAVEFATLDAGWGGQTTPWLLSNRWTASISADEQYLETRTMVGEAVFRSDMLRKFGWIPDDFRGYLVPPLAGRSQRFIDEIAVMPDGYTVRYRIRDVEMPLAQLDVPTDVYGIPQTNRKRRNIASVRFRGKRTFTTPGANESIGAAIDEINVAMQSTGMFANALGNAIAGVGEATKAAEALVGLTVLAQGAQILAIGGSALGAFYKSASSTIPTYQEVVVVEVAGNSRSQMRVLQDYAYSIVFGQLMTASLNTLIDIPVTALANWALDKLPKKLTKPVNEAIKEAVDTSIVSVVKDLVAALPPMSVLDLEYDTTMKYVKVTAAVTYSGLIDAVRGNTLAGRKRMADPIEDRMIGGDWPSIMNGNNGLAGMVEAATKVSQNIQNLANQPGGLTLGGIIQQVQQGLQAPGYTPKRLPDAGLLLFSPVGPGIGPPDDGVSRGNSLLNLVVADLLATGGVPPIPAEDVTWGMQPSNYPPYPYGPTPVPTGPGPTYDTSGAKADLPTT